MVPSGQAAEDSLPLPGFASPWIHCSLQGPAAPGAILPQAEVADIFLLSPSPAAGRPPQRESLTASVPQALEHQCAFEKEKEHFYFMWAPAIILIRESNLAVQPHIRPRTVPSGGYLTEREEHSHPFL